MRGVANVRWRQTGNFVRENYKNHKIFNDHQKFLRRKIGQSLRQIKTK